MLGLAALDRVLFSLGFRVWGLLGLGCGACCFRQGSGHWAFASRVEVANPQKACKFGFLEAVEFKARAGMVAETCTTPFSGLGTWRSGVKCSGVVFRATAK